MVLALEGSRHVSREEYDRRVERGLLRGEHVELVHGAILPMGPIGPLHANVTAILTELLSEQLRRRATLRIQLPFAAADASEPEPDVAIVPRGDYAKEHPRRALLLIEVADSSLAFDRETKAPLYASSDVDEYWIVDIGARSIEAHRVREGGRFTKVERFFVGGAVSLLALPDIVVAVAALFPT